VLDIGRHLVLPAATLGLFFTALYSRMMRASMLETADADFVRTARAKGVAPGSITRRHIARVAILPVVTLAGLQAGQIVGGAVLTETVFAWPGIGRLMFEALAQRDYQVLLGVFFVSSAMVVLFNLLTDLVYRLVDPRIGARVDDGPRPSLPSPARCRPPRQGGGREAAQDRRACAGERVGA
jgi:peptide/nickel transport system permease protein